LFLHGGPGFNAEMERRRYGASLAVEWWDQPRIPADAAAAFNLWVRAAEQKVRSLFEIQGGRVALLASSFGARLALEVLSRIPAMVGAVTISGGVVDPRAAFLRFGRRLAQKCRDQRLHHAVDEAAREPARETLSALINAIMATPHVMNEYWGPLAVEQCATMHGLAAQGALLDFETFEAVIHDVPAVPPAAIAEDLGRQIQVLIGRHDPYAEAGEVDYWRAWFPAATVELLDAGHFPHLELPPERWLRA